MIIIRSIRDKRFDECRMKLGTVYIPRSYLTRNISDRQTAKKGGRRRGKILIKKNFKLEKSVRGNLLKKWHVYIVVSENGIHNILIETPNWIQFHLLHPN